MSGCDREASIMMRPWPTEAVAPWWEGGELHLILLSELRVRVFENNVVISGGI